MHALKRYPWKRRRAVAREWNRRSHAAKARLRMERGPSLETVVARAKDDRRGAVLHVGHLYRGDGRVQPWVVRWSVDGRSDQFDILLDGRVWKTGGPRVIQLWLPGVRVGSAFIPVASVSRGGHDDTTLFPLLMLPRCAFD